jgi:hypothetical protein
MWVPKKISFVRGVRKKGDGSCRPKKIHKLSVHRFVCVNADGRLMLKVRVYSTLQLKVIYRKMTCPVSLFRFSLLGSFEFQTVNQQQMRRGASLPKTNGPPAQEM